ncbi:MAG: adenosylmethionine decarboxylase [Candidatus Omnitrophota bacterium]
MVKKEKEFCSSNGMMRYAGSHLIIELWDADNLDSISKIKKIFKDAIKACGATLLRMDMHKFSPYGGVSGMAIIAESHLSIHSWPEYKYAAIDVFVCGNVDPYKAIPVLRKGFKTKNIQVVEVKRGIF